MGNSKSDLKKQITKKDIIHDFEMRHAGKVLRATGKIPNNVGNRKWRRKIEKLSKI